MEKRLQDNHLEIRSVKGIELRDADADTTHIGVLTGYAAVFNSDSEEFAGWEKPWVERIAPGAFARTLRDMPDVVTLWSHDISAPVARTPDTLELKEDDTGLRVEIRLIDTARNRDLLAMIRAGIVDAMSFGFRARKSEFEEGDDRDIRTLLDVDLYEVSPVVWPAYPDTSIAERDYKAWREERSRQLSERANRPAEISPAPRRALWAARLGTNQPAHKE